MRIFRLLILLSLVFQTGCATLSKEDCAKADWAQIGHDDGAKGKRPEEFLKHRNACATHNIKADVETYQKSWANALLDEYCTEGRGFTLGRTGKIYHKICPKEVEYAFLKGYKRGRHLFFSAQDHEHQ